LLTELTIKLLTDFLGKTVKAGMRVDEMLAGLLDDVRVLD
jgi:hypothetical protein